MPIDKALLYVRTLRYLKPIQIWARLQKKLIRPQFYSVFDIQTRQSSYIWQSIIQKPQSLIGSLRFRFLNEEHELDSIGWDNIKISKLWRYNLHYFDDLVARDNALRKEWHEHLIQRWIEDNPPTQGSGWEPYTTSLRIVNWVKWLLINNTPPKDMMQSLADQAGWLFMNIEYHILGNHLFANAKALIFAGSFFDGSEAGKWLAKGYSILLRELNEQILSDGGHFELSPMYHAIILEDILDLIQIGRCYQTLPPSALQRMEVVAIKMLRWLKVMSHPDGQISFFNDSAFGVAANPQSLFDYARALGLILSDQFDSMEHLQDSGYIHVKKGSWSAILDVAKVGPDYLPGHAHADMLSFELSYGAERILVNSGVSEYELSDERLRQRGTSAHNTVEINSQNSAEIWSSFRVARRGKPLGLEIEDDDISCRVACAHNGYEYIQGRPIHRRVWSISAEEIIVTDLIKGQYEHADVHYHFHPDVKINLEKDMQLGTIQCKEHMLEFSSDGGSVQLCKSSFHSEFGKTLSNQKLIIRMSSDRLTFKIRPI